MLDVFAFFKQVACGGMRPYLARLRWLDGKKEKEKMSPIEEGKKIIKEAESLAMDDSKSEHPRMISQAHASKQLFKAGCGKRWMPRA